MRWILFVLAYLRRYRYTARHVATRLEHDVFDVERAAFWTGDNSTMEFVRPLRIPGYVLHAEWATQ